MKQEPLLSKQILRLKLAAVVMCTHVRNNLERDNGRR